MLDNLGKIYDNIGAVMDILEEFDLDGLSDAELRRIAQLSGNLKRGLEEAILAEVAA